MTNTNLFPCLLLGSGPTISIAILLNGCEMMGKGIRGARFTPRLDVFLTGITCTAPLSNVPIHGGPIKPLKYLSVVFFFPKSQLKEYYVPFPSLFTCISLAALAVQLSYSSSLSLKLNHAEGVTEFNAYIAIHLDRKIQLLQLTHEPSLQT